MHNHRKLNSLEQEILLQEQITIANEINHLEFLVANNAVNTVQNNRLRFWTFFFSAFIMVGIALYLLILFAISDLINISFALQKFLLISSAVLLILIPLFNVAVWVIVSLFIRNKNIEYIRANRIMLVRLERYYKLLKYEFDPEKYKLYDDDFTVDIDENGNLIKYVRFFNNDGSITTKPFTDMQELRQYIDNVEAKKQSEISNKRLLAAMEKFEVANKKFNEFTELDNNLNSKAIIDQSNIGATKFIKDTDFLPEQYQSKVSKWYNNEEFKDLNNFHNELANQSYDSNLDNNLYSSVDTSWLQDQFVSKKKGSNLFFKHYDLSAKSLGMARDVQEFVNLNRNFDLQKNPAINWEDTIDPKDFNKEKLAAYNKIIADYEQYSKDLTKQQLATEYELKHNRKNILRVELTDDIGVNVYDEYDPFKNIKLQLEKQQRRIDQVNKTKAILIENGIENVNFEGLSIKDLKHLAKQKIKEHNELLKLSKDKNVDAVIVLENNIAKIKAETFKEIHLPNERYQNKNGNWEYYDENGNYYEHNEQTDEWVPIATAFERFELDKDARILQLQQKYNDDLEKQLALQQEELDAQVGEIDQIENAINKKEKLSRKRKKELEKLKQQEKENKEFEREQNKEFEEIYQNKVENYQKQFDEDQKQIDIYVETHPANEPFLNDENKWMYHDGNNNYYVADEQNNWVSAPKPTKFKTIDNDKDDNNDLLSPWEKQEKTKQNDEPDNNQQATSTDDTYATQQNTNYQQDATTSSGGQQWQDENGYWWYLDEQGNYYYADENGNWIPYQQ